MHDAAAVRRRPVLRAALVAVFIVALCSVQASRALSAEAPDTILINGKLRPFFEVERGQILGAHQDIVSPGAGERIDLALDHRVELHAPTSRYTK